jgi:hypothetical protein
MRSTGKKLSIEECAMVRRCFAGGWQGILSAVLIATMIWPLPARALDLFTLWRQPMIPLHMIVGSWVDYNSVTQAEGRRSEDLVRIQCVGRFGDEMSDGWIIEIVPLHEKEGKLTPLQGEGLRLHLSQRLLQRDADLKHVIEKVERWQDGQPVELPPSEWRDDPFVASSLKVEFAPDTSELVSSSIRVVSGRELSCDHFQMTATDTQRVTLPTGHLEQVSRWEVTTAVNANVPFLGIVYAAERTHAESRLHPPSDRFAPPPPVTRIETMELIDYGNKAVPILEVH